MMNPSSGDIPVRSQAQPIYPFTLPIHSDELGRLPLHLGFNNMTTTADPNNDMWFLQGSAPAAPAQPQIHLQPSSDAPPQAGPPCTGVGAMTPLDSSMAPMFGAPGMSVYDHIFPVLSDSGLSAGPDAQAFSHVESGVPTLDGTGGSTMTGEMDPCRPPASPIDGGGFPDNTLAMWSNAPTNFE